MITTQIAKEHSKNLEEIRSMISILGKDCKEHYDSAIQNHNNQSPRRAYIRSVFAFIEGVVYRMKETALHFGENAGTLSIKELVVLSELSFKMNNKGEVISETVYPKFLHNFRFVFNMYSKSFTSSFSLDIGRSGWENLKTSSQVRNRLMHPKNTDDLEVTEVELESAKKAFEWFLISYWASSLYVQRAILDISDPTPNEVNVLDKEISDLEKEIKNKGS